MEIKIISMSGEMPEYKTEGSAGCDIKAFLNEPITIWPMEIHLIPTGLFVELPMGVEAQIRARSGLATKHGITMVNGVGTVDSDYRGEWHIPLINLGKDAYTINNGDRIAQAIFTTYERAEFVLTDKIDETLRGEGGFGHTGIK